MDKRLAVLEDIIFNPMPLLARLLAAGASTPAQIEAVLRDHAPGLSAQDVLCAVRYLRTAALCVSLGIKAGQDAYEDACETAPETALVKGGDAAAAPGTYDAVLDVVALSHLWLALDLEVAMGAPPLGGHGPAERGDLLARYVARIAGAAGSDWLRGLVGHRLAGFPTVPDAVGCTNPHPPRGGRLCGAPLGRAPHPHPESTIMTTETLAPTLITPMAAQTQRPANIFVQTALDIAVEIEARRRAGFVPPPEELSSWADVPDYDAVN